jgi:hypothetical protein
VDEQLIRYSRLIYCEIAGRFLSGPDGVPSRGDLFLLVEMMDEDKIERREHPLDRWKGIRA